MKRSAADKCHIVVQGGGPVATLGRALRQATPAAVRRWLGGPRNTLRVSARSSHLERRVGPRRPTDVIAASDLVLARRLSLPATARSDLRPAIELMVKSQTPFQPAELVIAAQALAPAAGGGASYDVMLLPRSRLEDAMREHGLGPTGRLTVEGRRDGGLVDLSAALDPKRGLRMLRWALPVALTFAAALTSLAIESARLGTAIDAASIRLDAELAALGAASNELEGMRAALADADLVQQTLGSAPSALATLSAVRVSLGEATDLLKIELRDGVYRLSLRADNALDAARTLGAALAGWSVSNDGAITRDMANGRESAVIALVPRAVE